jgi:hypothetical protein
MQTASHQESSPTMHTRQRSASSNNIPTVATVTLDEVRSRAGSDASQQMAIHQQQAQMMFEQQKRREEDRIRALLEVGGSSQAPQQPPLPSQVIEYGQNRDEDHDMGLELLQQPQESQSNQPMDNQESQAEGRDNSGRAGSWHSNWHAVVSLITFLFFFSFPGTWCTLGKGCKIGRSGVLYTFVFQVFFFGNGSKMQILVDAIR